MMLPEQFNREARRPDGTNRLYICLVEAQEYIERLITGNDSTPSMVLPISKWLSYHLDDSNPTPLCVCCPKEAVVTKGWPKKFVLLFPAGARANDIGSTVATVSAVCPSCNEREDKDILTTALDFLAPDDWRIDDGSS